MQVRFRRAQERDRDALIALCAAYRVADHQPAAEVEVRAAIDAALRGEPSIQLFLVSLDERIAGYFALTIGFSIEVGGRDAFLDELYIVPWAQSQGLGTQAIALASTFCRELDVKRLRMEVEHDNPRARRLYESLGFLAHERAVLSKRVDWGVWSPRRGTGFPPSAMAGDGAGPAAGKAGW